MRTVILLWLGLLMAASAAAAKPAGPWADWQAFQRGFIEQGRVVDRTTDGRTVSEGQAYAMFFALVANDRPQFDALLAWTERELANGSLATQLPSWKWGVRADGSRGVLDPNSASDADLWIAYNLLEAARLWRVPAYRQLGRSVLALVDKHSVVRITAGPTLLLPGPQGFALADGSYRLNPSYYVPAQLLRFAAEDREGPWSRLYDDYLAMTKAIAPLGRMPDWLAWQNGQWRADPLQGGNGSYDAIRCYLWAGLGAGRDARLRELRGSLLPFLKLRAEYGSVPEHWTLGDGGLSGKGPPGFSAALLPLALQAASAKEATKLRNEVLAAQHDGLYGTPADYYTQVLVLFGKGYADGRYRFDAQGRLIPAWR